MASNVLFSRFTAVISDLHLCEAAEPHPASPLWKKFKSREFFFDEAFQQFLFLLKKMASNEPIELILNGDIFDFDSVMALPSDPPYRISWLEKLRGMHAEEPKSAYKMRKILEDHPVLISSLREFILLGNRVIFVIGNHDLELHYEEVQNVILDSLDLPEEWKSSVVFNEFFYVSNQDTLVEHGNQYDPYCVCQNPISPFIQKFNKIEVRQPFGNLASRYMINGMGFFNPHSDSNYIMTLPEYFRFFFKYMLRAQPLIIWAWFWGASMSLFQSFLERLLPEVKDPLEIEDRVEDIARKANATPRMVRELIELKVHPASSYPLVIARELWLDRAFIVMIFFLVMYLVSITVKLLWSVSLFWIFIPLFLFLPFFIFYSKSISSKTLAYKEPKERVLTTAAHITGAKRIIYGHTHIIRHEMIGAVEHLNCGTWSPAFKDVECTLPVGHKNFVWLEPDGEGGRKATLYEFLGTRARPVFRQSPQLKRVHRRASS
ncbi:MAG: metallophosphoesterase [Bdellovibrionia bacterium]